MVLSKDNDTKRKDVFHDHPYKISRKQQKNCIQQQKDNNTSSAPGSSGTVMGKSSAEKVPNTLYNCVKKALAARKVWEAKRDRHSELMLQFAEKMVHSSVYYYKYIDPVLPCDWEYNPDTAGTLEPIDTIPVLSLVEKPEKKKMKTKSFEDGDDDSDSSFDSSSDSLSDCDPDVSPILLHKLMGVPLKEDDIESWLQFMKFDEGYTTSVPDLQPHHLFYPVNVQHPFVSVVGNLAVNCFNEAFNEFVDKDEHNHIRDPEFLDCTYLKSDIDMSYLFNMNILADEYGFRGIYAARVECFIDDGERTLHRFVLTDIKCGKKGRPPKSKS